MIDRSEGGRVAAQRFKESAFSGPAVKRPPDNATRQRKALAKMSLLEREFGMTEAEWDEFHRIQRERVFARYGIKVAS